MKISMDGKIVDPAQARVSVFDHGLLYGDGVFEGIRVYRGCAFKLAEHVRRLYQSAKAIRLEIPFQEAEMVLLIEEAVAAEDSEEGYIRVVVTRGEGPLGIDPDHCPKATVIIIVGSIQLYPQEFYEKGIATVTASSRRSPVDVLDPRVKSLNYLNNILAKIEAKQAGCMEAIMLTTEGLVAECTADNLFIAKEGMLFTPDTSLGVLDGITRGVVFDLAANLGIEVKDARLTRYDLYTADECFLTGTGAEIMPVTTIDGRAVGTGLPGGLTMRLARAFRELVGGSGHKLGRLHS